MLGGTGLWWEWGSKGTRETSVTRTAQNRLCEGIGTEQSVALGSANRTGTSRESSRTRRELI